MYFKKLEAIGFKSFGEKTVIEFDAGVTAIVGPNGCGKSNIADSIRWALGEQSAKSLRGGSMEDVIFNGSSSKEALNLAEVSITLSNSSKILPIDYEEVTITRRLYRSGESEYLLNGNTVRLRDIHELLMGTGIGTESYSIIEQGKMDVILNSKPEERREIFEEAAGITKFKSKKKEALRKLEQTDQNLLRVNDIIQEVKRQIGSIERQAKKAQVYQEEFEKLKKMELGVASREFLTFRSQKEDKERHLDFLRQKEEESQEGLKSVQNTYHEGQAALDAAETKLEEKQREELELSHEIRRGQDRVLLNRERIGEVGAKKENLNRQIQLSQKRANEFREEYERLQADFEKAAREEAEGQAFLAGVEAEFQVIQNLIQESFAREESIKSSLVDNARRRSASQNELLRVRGDLNALEFRVQRINQEKIQALSNLESANQEAQSVRGENQRQEENLRALLTEKESFEKGLDLLRADLNSDEEKLKSFLLQKSNLETRIHFLKDLNEKHEGFLGGVKALLEEKKNASSVGNGVVGVLAELLSVNRGYELAAEAALEAYLQALVFESDAKVLEAVSFLRGSRKGRALLLSLEFRRENSGISAAPEGTRALTDFVQVKDGRLNSLLRELLSNVSVVADSAAAHEWAKRHPHRVFVTPDGERFEGQLIYGGSLSQEADVTLVGREARIEQYEADLKSLDAESRQKEEAIRQKTRDEASFQENLKSQGDKILDAQRALSDLQSRLRAAEEKSKRHEEERDLFEREIQLVQSDLAALRRKEQEFADEERRFTDEENALRQELLNLDKLRREKGDKKEDLLVRLTEVRSKQGFYVAQREKIEKDKHWAAESKSNEESQVLLFQSELNEGQARQAALEAENETLTQVIESQGRTRDELLAAIESLRQEKETRVRELDSLEREKDEKESFLNEARQKLHQFDLENTKIQFEIDRLKERIFNAYQIDLDIQGGMQSDIESAFGQMAADANEDFDEIKRQIQAQRDKLQKMGPVNLVAIQEFDEMKERYEFLTKQEADLVQAKDDLQKAIQKINRTTRELFADTFQKVQANFTEYYKLLFGGGHAELVLLDEENILESGIEIVARPPGKKLQSISLLSGGEKALTAVALLFSLFKVKPSPFCILDEIDAPLDESNVDRFCSVLKEFIKESQFILITHNKRTMSLADAMYGITMQQTGVSRVVSVRFHEYGNRRQTQEKSEVLI